MTMFEDQGRALSTWAAVTLTVNNFETNAANSLSPNSVAMGTNEHDSPGWSTARLEGSCGRGW